MDYDWKPVANQDLFPNNYENVKILLFLQEPPLVRRRESDSKLREGGRPGIRPNFQKEFPHHRMYLEYARLVFCRYFGIGTVLNLIATPKEQYTLAKPASLIMNATLPDVEVGRAPPGFEVPKDEDDWTMGDQVKVDAEERVGQNVIFVIYRNNVVSRGGKFR